MHCIGVDIVEIARIRRALGRWGGRFLARVYTEPEVERYGGQAASLAARFAAKEAVMKALAAPEMGVSWHEIEILSDDRGRPVLRLYGRAKALADGLGLTGLDVSLSHSKEYAVAMVVGEAGAGQVQG